jgi:hypothetical protein
MLALVLALLVNHSRFCRNKKESARIIFKTPTATTDMIVLSRGSAGLPGCTAISMVSLQRFLNNAGLDFTALTSQ